jgi:hypothetical protein
MGTALERSHLDIILGLDTMQITEQFSDRLLC